MVWLFVLPVLDVPAKVRLVAIGSGINSDMFVKLWTKRSTLCDDMLDKWVTASRMKLCFQCSLLGMLPRMSLSHHNTLYMKQPLQKATRFIPMRQVELPIRLWIVVCFGHGPCRDPRGLVFFVFLIRLNHSFPIQISTLNHTWFGYCWFSWWSITMYNVLQWIATPIMVCFIPLLIYHYFFE